MSAQAPEPLTPAQQALVSKARSVVERIASDVHAKYRMVISKAELVSLGNAGLVEAARSFDPDLGAPFGKYAEYRVEGAMLDEVRKQTAFYKTAGLSARMAALQFLGSSRDTSNPLTDTDDDCARRLKAFSDGLLASMFAATVTAAVRDADEGEAARKVDYGRACEALDEATAGLPDRDRKLIDLHYRKDKELKDVARELGVSYATVRRYHNSVMERLAVRLRGLGIREMPEGSE